MHNNHTVDLESGYEWYLMKEAKARNPDIKLYGLPWPTRDGSARTLLPGNSTRALLPLIILNRRAGTCSSGSRAQRALMGWTLTMSEFGTSPHPTQPTLRCCARRSMMRASTTRASWLATVAQISATRSRRIPNTQRPWISLGFTTPATSTLTTRATNSISPFGRAKSLRATTISTALAAGRASSIRTTP